LATIAHSTTIHFFIFFYFPIQLSGSYCSYIVLILLNFVSISSLGVGKDDTDAASVRANFPMRPQCGIFYFEVEIVSKGRDGYIGIGFCWQSNLLNRLPGWDDHSWGYHGDDGHSFCSSGNGKPYGPKFGTGDTIGCGVNFQDMSAFYTKNGVDLGTAFQGLQGASLYPCVGFRTPGEQVEVNFGEREFKFDIEHYVKVRKKKEREKGIVDRGICIYQLAR